MAGSMFQAMPLAPAGTFTSLLKEMLLAVAPATSAGVEAGLRRTVWEMLLTIPYGQTIILPLGREGVNLFMV